MTRLIKDAVVTFVRHGLLLGFKRRRHEIHHPPITKRQAIALQEEDSEIKECLVQMHTEVIRYHGSTIYKRKRNTTVQQKCPSRALGAFEIGVCVFIGLERKR